MKANTRNCTRWSSTISLIQRALEIHQFLDDGEDSETTEFVLGPADHKKIKELSSILQDFESVTQVLQNSTRNLHEIRCLFDGVISENSSMRSYLASDADIVHSKEFEVAIVKLQGGLTDSTPEETVSLSKLIGINDSSEVLVLPNNTSLAGRALSKQVRKKSNISIFKILSARRLLLNDCLVLLGIYVRHRDHQCAQQHLNKPFF